MPIKPSPGIGIVSPKTPIINAVNPKIPMMILRNSDWLILLSLKKDGHSNTLPWFARKIPRRIIRMFSEYCSKEFTKKDPIKMRRNEKKLTAERNKLNLFSIGILSSFSILHYSFSFNRNSPLRM